MVKVHISPLLFPGLYFCPILIKEREEVLKVKTKKVSKKVKL